MGGAAERHRQVLVGLVSGVPPKLQADGGCRRARRNGQTAGAGLVIAVRRSRRTIGAGPVQRDIPATDARQAHRHLDHPTPAIAFAVGDIGNAHAGQRIVIGDGRGRGGVTNGRTAGIAQPQLELLVRLIQRVATHIHGNRLGRLARSECQRARRALVVVIDGCRRAVTRRVVQSDRAGAFRRQPNLEHHRTQSAIAFGDLHVGNRHGGHAFVIDDRARGSRAFQTGIRRSSQRDREGLVLLAHRVTGDLHFDGLGRLTRCKRQGTAGGHVVTICRRGRAIGGLVIHRHRAPAGGRETDGEHEA